MRIALLTAIAAPLLLLAKVALGDHQTLTSGSKIKWGPPPPAFPQNAKFALIDGDPASTGLVTVRVIMPAGYTVPPHWHPTDEHVTVLSGSLSLGMGDTIDKAHATTLKTGGYAVAPANMHHYAFTTGGATIQIHMVGPFGITYVNPADDPRNAPKK